MSFRFFAAAAAAETPIFALCLSSCKVTGVARHVSHIYGPHGVAAHGGGGGDSQHAVLCALCLSSQMVMCREPPPGCTRSRRASLIVRSLCDAMRPLNLYNSRVRTSPSDWWRSARGTPREE